MSPAKALSQASNSRLRQSGKERDLSISYLVKVDDGLPEVVLLLVEVSHTDLTEVTRMVLIEVGANHRNRRRKSQP